VHLFGEVCL